MKSSVIRLRVVGRTLGVEVSLHRGLTQMIDLLLGQVIATTREMVGNLMSKLEKIISLIFQKRNTTRLTGEAVADCVVSTLPLIFYQTVVKMPHTHTVVKP